MCFVEKLGRKRERENLPKKCSKMPNFHFVFFFFGSRGFGAIYNGL